MLVNQEIVKYVVKYFRKNSNYGNLREYEYNLLNGSLNNYIVSQWEKL